jgi:hypothetical protein
MLEYIKTVTRKELLENKIDDDGEDLSEDAKEIFSKGKPLLALTEYHYQLPTEKELTTFINENSKKGGKTSKFFQKYCSCFDNSTFFKKLFPKVKEEKPGVDLYAPMVVMQLLLIVFEILFYTRMDPDYSNSTSDDLTPNTLNTSMIVVIFITLTFIIIDRYLYLAQNEITIDKIEVEEESEDDETARITSDYTERSDSIDLPMRPESRRRNKNVSVKYK